MAYEITNSQDFFDSRGVLERIEDLECIHDDMIDNPGLAENWEIEEIVDELKSLKSLKDSWGDDRSFEWGVTFIREDYFEDYARELAQDLGYLTDKTYQWPYNHIGWEAAAEQLKIDYEVVDFDGVTYYGRE